MRFLARFVSARIRRKMWVRVLFQTLKIYPQVLDHFDDDRNPAVISD